MKENQLFSGLLDLRARLDIEGGSVCHVIDRGQGPRQANSQEHVDRVAARYVSNAIVRRFILLGCNDAGKCVCKLSEMYLKLDVRLCLTITWYAGAKGDEADGRNRVLDVQGTAEIGGRIANDRGNDANNKYRNNEG